MVKPFAIYCQKVYFPLIVPLASHRTKHNTLVIRYSFMAAEKSISKNKNTSREPKDMIKDVYHRIPLPYQSLNIEACIIDVNDVWLATFGYSRKEVIGKSLTDFLTDETREVFDENFALFVKAGGFIGGELEYFDKKGNIRHILIDGMVDYDEEGKFKQTRTFLRDITLEHDAEMELHRLAARNSALLGSIPEIIMEVDNKKVYTWSNQAGLDFFGLDVIGRNAAEFFIGKQDIDKKVERVFTGSEFPVYVESWQRRHDGQARLLAWWCKTLKDDNGEIKGALSSARDITDTFQKEERINHLNAMLAGIRNVNRLINKESDPKRLLEGVCENLAGQMGYLSAWGAILSPDTRTAVFTTSSGLGKKAFTALKKLLEKGELPRCTKSVDANDNQMEIHQYHNCAGCALREWHKEHDSILGGMITAPLRVKGQVFSIIAVSVPLRYVGDVEVVSLFQEVARDISQAFEKIEKDKELKYLRREQLKIGKLESLGVMAGGIAHDFNNLLVGILGNISLAKLSTKKDDPVIEYLDSAEIASRRARDLTQQLLTFAKGGSPVKGEVQVDHLLKESVKFILRDSSIKVRFRIDKGLHNVSGDESQLNQVFNNLLINACEAMPQGGLIRISAENEKITADSRFLAQSEAAWIPVEGEYVKIRIADSGIGMSEEIMEKIFDPYFTTKKSGSGLGLSSVFSIVKSHDGKISVKSKPNKGATFTILLPAIVAHKEKRKDTSAKDAKLLEQANVLVMDDEALVRSVLTGFLKSFKCRIKTAEHGEETVAAYKKALKTDPFDIVILDLSVPGKMGGIETAAELLKINPQVRMIVSSGYSDDDAIANYKKYGFAATLRKPYTVEELKTTMKKLLGS